MLEKTDNPLKSLRNRRYALLHISHVVVFNQAFSSRTSTQPLTVGKMKVPHSGQWLGNRGLTQHNRVEQHGVWIRRNGTRWLVVKDLTSLCFLAAIARIPSRISSTVLSAGELNSIDTASSGIELPNSSISSS